MMAQTLTGRAARIEDVAALAGVSLATASKALHNKPRISEENQAARSGRRAARYLVDAIDGNPHHGVNYVPCRLIQRESTLPLD